MWEGKETADDTDAAIINLNDTLGNQQRAVAVTKDEWDRLAGDLDNMAANELHRLEQAIENDRTALIDFDAATGDADATLGGLSTASDGARTALGGLSTAGDGARTSLG